MKRFILIIAISLLLIPSCLAQRMYEFNNSITVNEDGTSNFRMDFKFSDDIKNVEIPLNGKISDLKAENGNCEIVEQISQVISCKPSSPFIVGTITISANFKIEELVQKRGNISLFSLDIPILWDTDELYVTVILPEKTVLAEKVLLPVSPSGEQMKFDGKRIISDWSFFNKKSGDLIPIRIYYEPLTHQPIQIFYTWSIALIMIIIIIGVALVYRKISYKKSELVFSVLNESERIVIEVIKKEKKEIVDQRKIVAESSFSKAKVSRIIKNLEERGIIESERTGRKNRIRLKKQFSEK